jgi:hypothetical protein
MNKIDDVRRISRRVSLATSNLLKNYKTEAPRENPLNDLKRMIDTGKQNTKNR